MAETCEIPTGRRQADDRRPAPPRWPPPDNAPRTWALVGSEMGCVSRLVREFRNFGIPLEDLEAEAVLGLVEAAGRFDERRGVSFLSYATWWVRKRISTAVSRQSGIVRLSRYRLERLRRVRTAERDLGSLHGRRPTREEIGARAGVPVREVELLQRLSRREVSLDDVVDPESGLRVVDRLAEAAAPGPDEDLLREEGRRLVSELLALLPERDREIVRMRYGLDGAEASTLAEIAEKYGLSRERVRQVEANAIRRLRALEARGSPLGARRRRSFQPESGAAWS